MRQLGWHSKTFLLNERRQPEGYTLDNLIYLTVWKRQNYSDGKCIRRCQGYWCGEGVSVRGSTREFWRMMELFWWWLHNSIHVFGFAGLRGRRWKGEFYCMRFLFIFKKMYLPLFYVFWMFRLSVCILCAYEPQASLVPPEVKKKKKKKRQCTLWSWSSSLLWVLGPTP